jgi:hypothetical protein
MTSDYLDDWQFDVKVVSESVYVTDSSITQAKMEDKLRLFTTYFPQFFALNQEKLIKDVLTAYRDDIDEYDTMAAMQAMNPEAQMPGQGQPPGAEMATSGEQGMTPMPAQ